jgi:hypothetical protein
MSIWPGTLARHSIVGVLFVVVAAACGSSDFDADAGFVNALSARPFPPRSR